MSGFDSRTCNFFKMKQLATHFRYLQLLAHNGHNEAKGLTFFADHAFLGDLYPAYEEAYDALIERLIGSGERIDLAAIQAEAAGKLEAEKDTEAYLVALLDGEAEACAQIEKLAKSDITQGTLNLLAGLADDSEQRSYKLRQRLL